MKIKTFYNLPWAEKKMFFTNLGLCGLARIAVLTLSYNTISRYFGKPCHVQISSPLISTKQLENARRIRRTVQLAARYTPWTSNCLVQALAAIYWCQRHQVPYMLFIGLAKDRTKPLGREAHAWIISGPIAITGGQSLVTHHVIGSYTHMSTI